MNIMDKIKRAMPLILSGIMVITVFIIQFIVVSFKDEFRWNEFLSQLAVNLFLLVATGHYMDERRNRSCQIRGAVGVQR